MHVQIIEALAEECHKNDIVTCLHKTKDNVDAWLLIKMDGHDFKIKIIDGEISLMLRQCLHVDDLYHKSPYGKAYEVIKRFSLDDPQCFNYVISDLRKKWFLDL